MKPFEGTIYLVGSHLQSHGSTDLNQEGIIYFYMNNLPGACGTTHKRIAVTTNHPLFNTFSAMILSAHAQSATVNGLYIDSCTYRSDAWDLAVLAIKQ